MQDNVIVTGMIILSSPIKEYDRRVEIVTRERGRISAFATGARKATNSLSACTIPFTYGEFSIYEGRNSYNLRGGKIIKYFGDIAADYDKTCYASYFAELVQYFTRENISADDELLLLYATLLALQHGNIDDRLIRVIFEMKIMQIAGFGIELFECLGCHSTEATKVFFSAGGLYCDECIKKEKELKEAYPLELSGNALYTLQYILSAKIEKLYTFKISEEVLNELVQFTKVYFSRNIGHKFRTLDFL